MNSTAVARRLNRDCFVEALRVFSNPNTGNNAESRAKIECLRAELDTFAPADKALFAHRNPEFIKAVADVMRSTDTRWVTLPKGKGAEPTLFHLWSFVRAFRKRMHGFYSCSGPQQKLILQVCEAFLKQLPDTQRRAA